MGACTSKFNVMGEGYKAHKPEEEEVVVEEEKKKDTAAVTAAALVVSEQGITQKRQGDEEKNGVKSRSLGNLFKKNDELKDSSKSETVKNLDVSEVNPKKETETGLIAVEQQVVVAPLVDAPPKEIHSDVVKPAVEEVKDAAAPVVDPKPAVEEVKDAAAPVVDPKPAVEEFKDAAAPVVDPKPAVEVKNVETTERKSEELKPSVEVENAETSTKISEAEKTAEASEELKPAIYQG